ncbi:ABC-type transport system, involved in lipoprotein release, permease component [Desulfitobacterium dehalogenans ATCC 51507]|uniref:ABC-type transport system, involved in lipoprotein release, permease component n=1 Tax=Desulfitobacterium dehalogenans (strain ATCC 51507 / DSM 9161 / JW/IU-DC1) TaxID=756499 RepID=I4A7X1_DESDJ|nr:ABC transporter permease [Desulfitobacterium dehalogenans]AFM00056.1 ABC-type transport system, involved in lipoprotein release, permease component [Desulfitobacterium dehalogenans ATCC 51507]
MKSYLDLIPISAKVHKKQSRMTRICIVLAVFLVTAIFGMADMELRSQQLQEIKKGGNWHVLFSGIDEHTAAMIAARPEVKFSGWYTYLGEKEEYTLSGKSVAAVGLDKNTFEEMLPTQITEGVYPTGENEAALTVNAKSGMGINLGDIITLEHSGSEPVQLTVVGFVEGTSQLLKQDTHALLLTTEGLRSSIPQEGYTSQYMVQLSPYCTMQKVIADITKQYGLADQQVLENGNLLAVLGQSDNNYVLGLYGIAGVLFIVVLLAGVLMIAGSLNSNVMQRTEFFGMLRCLGATQKQIMRFVRREGMQWCKTAIPLGLGMGIMVVWALCGVLKILSPGYFSELPTFGISWISILSGIAVGIVTVLLAAQSPAKKAARVSPLAAVSGNANSVQPISGAANTTLFKIETALGIHHATSSKKNFLLMVGSFSLSIILFLSFSATVDFMHHAVRPLKPWTPDLSIVSTDNTPSVSNGLLEELRDHRAVKRAYGRMFAYDIPVKVKGQERTINLISYEDYQFTWAQDSLIEGSLDEGAQKKDQVWVVYDSENPLQVGDQLALSFGEVPKEVRVAGVLSTSPFSSVEGVDSVICSEGTFRELTGERNYTIIDIQLSSGATDEDVDEIRSLAGPDVRFSDQRAGNREGRGAFYSMALFIYGFLAVILLITVFNIVNSVAMSVAARLKQYGAMRAIGMSDHQLVKMVRAEAITYAAAGSSVGCILGVTLHKLVFEKMITSHWGDPWQLPLGELSLIVAIVMITSLLAVHGPAKQIHTMSIVDTISAK